MGRKKPNLISVIIKQIFVPTEAELALPLQTNVKLFMTHYNSFYDSHHYLKLFLCPAEKSLNITENITPKPPYGGSGVFPMNTTRYYFLGQFPGPEGQEPVPAGHPY